MADHTIMHVQYSNGVTIWQHVLKWEVKYEGRSINKLQNSVILLLFQI